MSGEVLQNLTPTNDDSKTKKDEETGARVSNSPSDSTTHTRNDKLSLPDLPNDFLAQIFSYLDFPSILGLRVNKQMEQRLLSFQFKLEEIKLVENLSCFSISVDTWAPHPRRKRVYRYLDITLQRSPLCPRNTTVKRIAVVMRPELKGVPYGIIDALLKFRGDQLEIVCVGYEANNRPILTQLTFPQLLMAAENFTEIWINMQFSSLTATELCLLSKKMLDGECKLRSFTLVVEDSQREALKLLYSSSPKWLFFSDMVKFDKIRSL